MATALNQPGEIPFDLKEKILTLQNAILEKHPKMPTLLREIHTTLSQYPENVTLLSDEEIGIIVSGLKEHTNTVLVSSSMKTSNATAKKRLASLSVDDL